MGLQIGRLFMKYSADLVLICFPASTDNKLCVFIFILLFKLPINIELGMSNTKLPPCKEEYVIYKPNILDQTTGLRHLLFIDTHKASIVHFSLLSIKIRRAHGYVSNYFTKYSKRQFYCQIPRDAPKGVLHLLVFQSPRGAADTVGAATPQTSSWLPFQPLLLVQGTSSSNRQLGEVC